MISSTSIVLSGVDLKFLQRRYLWRGCYKSALLVQVCLRKLESNDRFRMNCNLFLVIFSSQI
ncbi:hypothetical protein Peur_022388 [Populus x canadensis]|uniref:Uncharacterized protein n=1 Tax=Populus trichocarpa TaxID=3694 RepID=A0A3N7FY89_POPTR